MSLRQQAVALATLSRKEYHRVVRIWLQTVLPPAINMGLYFLIFGELIGARIGHDRIFPTLPTAVAAYQEWVSRNPQA